MIVPRSLRAWFVAHAVADVLAAVPLLVAPRALLGPLGWSEVDPVATRLVAAALLGIGIQSWLGRDEGLETFLGMLNLKVIWSTSAIVGIAISIAQGAPAAAWLVLGVFVPFSAAWWTFRLRLRAA